MASDVENHAMSSRIGGAGAKSMQLGSRQRRNCQSYAELGFTFVELALSMLILVIISAVMVNHLTINLQSTLSERDRLFAFGKAQGILAEVQSHVDRGQVGPAEDLDALDDGSTKRGTLSIATDENGVLVLPDHVLSSNWRRDGQWVWSRRISVEPFAGLNNRNVRYVTVRIFQKDMVGRDVEVADVSAVVNAAGGAFPTTQVFDIYLLAIENIPGWWVFMDSIRPFVESTITDLETRNPGLELRTHWITKASFGRNASYRPYINEDFDSLQSMPEVYHYPGRMPVGSSSSYYYVPANIKARYSRDGVERNGYDAVQNPYPYALCDYWNHSMRQPQEQALWAARVSRIEQREAQIASAQASGSTVPAALEDMSKEPTMRMFLDDLYGNPNKYRNALIVNLHGELLPMPSLRNFSDPARSPTNLLEARVVTHPEKLRTPRIAGGVGTENAKFRVYAFKAIPANNPTLRTIPQVTVDVLGVDLTNPTTTNVPDLDSRVALQCLSGGVPLGTSVINAPYTVFANAPVYLPSLLANTMSYSAIYLTVGSESFTRITLYNTPCIAPPDATGAGLQATAQAQLYGMEYVPGSVDRSPDVVQDFTRDLANTVTPASTKNTARWRFQVPAAMVANLTTTDRVLEVRTRIWAGTDPANAGTVWPTPNDPDNLSTTFTWWCDSKEDVPITERSQFLGDPRHNPYRDLLRDQTTPANDFHDGYNWFFDALSASARTDNPGLDPARMFNRWKGVINCDVARYMELLRKGLVASKCVYTTLTGFSYYYLGIGADIGYDAANGYPNSIPVNQQPYGGTGPGFVNTITNTRTYVRAGTSGTGYWWGLPWLGELYPDAQVAQWRGTNSAQIRGNLDAGTGATQFRQGSIATVPVGTPRLGFGTTLGTAQQRTNNEGCTSFFNIGTSSSSFHHQYASGNGTLTSTGTEISTNYNFNMPAAAPISRPWSIATNSAGGLGDEFALTPYSAERYSARMLKTYYTHPNGNIGSGLLQLTDPANTASAFLIVNGIDRTVESGSSFIAKFAVLSLVHSFFEAGPVSVARRIEQPPRVEIVQPTDITELVDPIDVEIKVNTSFTRWDGVPYTTTGTFAESEAAMDYVLMYSNDGGINWRYCQGNSTAVPGVRPSVPALLLPDAGPGQETYSWAVPSTQFPQGSYLLRVDCFRRGAPIHYSYHKTKLFIQR